MFDDYQQIVNFLTTNDTCKHVAIDENTHDQSLIEAQNHPHSPIPNILITISSFRIEKFYDLQDKFKKVTN